jgi:hypothetical protein
MADTTRTQTGRWRQLSLKMTGNPGAPVLRPRRGRVETRTPDGGLHYRVSHSEQLSNSAAGNAAVSSNHPCRFDGALPHACDSAIARAFQGVMNQQLGVGNAGVRRAIRIVGAVAARRILRG